MRKQLFLDLQNRLTVQVPELKALDLFNHQFSDFKSEGQDLEYPFEFPNVFIEFVGGGRWTTNLNSKIRENENYTIRLHVGLTHYEDSHRGSLSQLHALEHLDFIDKVINALDTWQNDNLLEIRFTTDAVDHLRTNIIEHNLDFECHIIDCSLMQQVELSITTSQATTATTIVTNNTTTATNYQTSNQPTPPPYNPYKI
ncbi:MAG: hypothetical protein RLZZ292_2423 [Bacteroidota bacterium]|jgi:hypothetical protein